LLLTNFFPELSLYEEEDHSVPDLGSETSPSHPPQPPPAAFNPSILITSTNYAFIFMFFGYKGLKTVHTISGIVITFAIGGFTIILVILIFRFCLYRIYIQCLYVSRIYNSLIGENFSNSPF
jgi:hypothetical protein